MDQETDQERLIGHFKTKVDSAGRFPFPTILRSQLGDRAEGPLWLVHKKNPPVLEIIPDGEWQNRLAETDDLNDLDPATDLIDTHYYCDARKVHLDNAQRILISSDIRERLGLVKEIVVVGKRRKILVYSKSAYEKEQALAEEMWAESRKKVAEHLAEKRLAAERLAEKLTQAKNDGLE